MPFPLVNVTTPDAVGAAEPVVPLKVLEEVFARPYAA